MFAKKKNSRKASPKSGVQAQATDTGVVRGVGVTNLLRKLVTTIGYVQEPDLWNIAFVWRMSESGAVVKARVHAIVDGMVQFTDGTQVVSIPETAILDSALWITGKGTITLGSIPAPSAPIDPAVL